MKRAKNFNLLCSSYKEHQINKHKQSGVYIYSCVTDYKPLIQLFNLQMIERSTCRLDQGMHIHPRAAKSTEDEPTCILFYKTTLPLGSKQEEKRIRGTLATKDHCRSTRSSLHIEKLNH